MGRVVEWDEKREQEEPENCPDQPPRTYYKAQEVLHRWATISLLASLAEITQRPAKSHIHVRSNGFILHRNSCSGKVNCGRHRKPRASSCIACQQDVGIAAPDILPLITAAALDLDIRTQNRYAICTGVIQNP